MEVPMESPMESPVENSMENSMGDSIENPTEYFLAAFSALFSLSIVLLLVTMGWYLVWTFFLSRFRFVRELTGKGMSESSSVTDLKNGRSRLKKFRRD